MQLRGGLPGAAAPDQQQHLVGGVGRGVHRLGEHRGRPGEEERHELAGRDPDIGGQGGDDRPECATFIFALLGHAPLGITSA
jgi:hypothetical protein